MIQGQRRSIFALRDSQIVEAVHPRRIQTGDLGTLEIQNDKLLLLPVEKRPNLTVPCIPQQTQSSILRFHHQDAVPVYDHSVILRKTDGTYEGVCWNICKDEREEVTLSLDLPLNGKWVLTEEIVDETNCNPLKAWHDMGEPASLTDAQLRFLRQAGQPLCETAAGKDGKFTLTLRENAVIRFTVQKVQGNSDIGYDYEWYVQNR